MSYKSYGKTVKKLSTAWEQAQATSSDIQNDVKIINANFYSFNDLKVLKEFVIVNNYYQTSNNYVLGSQFTAMFSNLPDEYISSAFLNVSICFYDITKATSSAVNLSKAIILNNAAQVGKLKIGDIEIVSLTYISFWKKLPTGWKFHFQPRYFINIVTSVTNGGIGGWSSNLQALYINTSLIFLNEKSNHAIQSGK